MSKDCANKKPLNASEKQVVQRLSKFDDSVMNGLAVTSRIGEESGEYQSELVQLHPGDRNDERKMSMHGVRGLVIDLVKGRIVRLGLTPTLETVVNNGLGPLNVKEKLTMPTSQTFPMRPQVVGSTTQLPGSMYPGAWDPQATPSQSPDEKEDDEYYKFLIEAGDKTWAEELRIDDSVIMPHYPGVALTVFLWKGKIYISSNKCMDIESSNSRWGDHTENFSSLLSKISGFYVSELYPDGAQNSTRVHYFYLVHPSFNLCSNVMINPEGFLIYDGFLDLINDPTIWEDKRYIYSAPTIADKNISKLNELTGVVARWTITHDTANVILRMGYVIPFGLTDPKRLHPGETVIVRNLTTGISVSVQSEGRKYILGLFKNNVNIYMNFVNIMADACKIFDNEQDIEDFKRKYPIVAYPTSDRLNQMIMSRKTLISYVQVINGAPIHAYTVHQKIDMLHYLLLSLSSNFMLDQMLNFRNRFYFDLSRVVSFILENLNNRNDPSIFDKDSKDDKKRKEDLRLIAIISNVIRQTTLANKAGNVSLDVNGYRAVAWYVVLHECSGSMYQLIRSIYRRYPLFKRDSIRISEPGAYTYSEIQAMKLLKSDQDEPYIMPDSISMPANVAPIDESKIQPPIQNLAISGDTYNDGQ